MKWFKHFSDLSLDDKIERLEARLGLVGYARHIKLIELCAMQLKSKSPQDTFYFNMKSLQNKLSSKPKQIKNQLRTSTELGFWKASVKDNEVKIIFPKLLEIRDNHTRNLQVGGKRSDPVDKDKEKEEDINISSCQKQELALDPDFGEFIKTLKDYGLLSPKVKRNAEKIYLSFGGLEEFNVFWEGLQGTNAVKEMLDKGDKAGFRAYVYKAITGEVGEIE